MIQYPALQPAEAVANGVALLDRVKPGWRADIDRSSFDIDDSWQCVLGQLYGIYCEGVDQLGRIRETLGEESWARATDRERTVLENVWAQHHGFLGAVALDGENEPSREGLQEAWVAEL